MTQQLPISFRLTAGNAGFLFGGIALILVLVQFAAGPFAPQQTIGVSIGEIAAEIRQSAANALAGQTAPEPQVSAWNIDRILSVIAAVTAGAAILLGMLAFILRENRKTAAYALTLGVGAVLFQMFVWTIMLVAGVFLLIGIMQNLDSILDF